MDMSRECASLSLDEREREKESYFRHGLYDSTLWKPKVMVPLNYWILDHNWIYNALSDSISLKFPNF